MIETIGFLYFKEGKRLMFQCSIHLNKTFSSFNSFTKPWVSGIRTLHKVKDGENKIVLICFRNTNNQGFNVSLQTHLTRRYKFGWFFFFISLSPPTPTPTLCSHSFRKGKREKELERNEKSL